MLELSKALTFYSEGDNTKKNKPWVLNFAEKRNYPQDIQEKLSQVKDPYFQTIGAVCHLLDSGKILPEIYDEDFIKNKILLLTNTNANANDSAFSVAKNTTSSAIPEESSKNSLSLKNPAEVKAESLFAVIDQAIEVFVKTKRIPEIPCVVKSSGKEELDILHSWIKDSWNNEISYLNLSLEGDEFYQEAYSHFSEEEKKSLIKFYQEVFSIIHCAKPTDRGIEITKNSLGKISTKKDSKEKVIVAVPVNKKNVKKTKQEIQPLFIENDTIENDKKENKIKQKKKNDLAASNKTKLLQNFIYKKEFEPFVSFDPLDIFDSKVIYILDTKYNSIMYLVPEANTNFSIKSRSIINISESKMKNIPRKMFASLTASILKGNVVTNKKIFDAIPTAEREFPGRISQEMILLKRFF